MSEKIDEKKAAATAGASNSTNTDNAAEQARAIADARSHAMICERMRCGAILRASAAAQRDLALKLIDDGNTTIEALTQLNVDLTERLSQARTLPSESTKSLAGGNSAKVAGATDGEDARIKAMPEGDEKWKAEFAASKELQAEFGTFDLYRGWKRNDQVLEASKARD